MNAKALIALAAVLFLIAAFFAGQHQGKKIERAEWQAKEIKAAQDAADRLAEVQDETRQAEQAHQAAMVAASSTYLKELAHVRTEKDRVIANLRAGAIRLRDPGPYSFGRDSMPTTCPGAGRCDGGTGADLSDAAAEFLVHLASEADEVTRQLAACQRILTEDRAALGQKKSQNQPETQ